MKIRCIACQTALELQADQISETGSMVRCLMCSYIFMIFPPDCYGKPVTQDTNIDQSILDELIEMQNETKAQLSIDKLPEEEPATVIDPDIPGDDFGSEPAGSVTDEPEYADLPDLSELENMIDWDDINELDEPPARSNQNKNDPRGSIYDI